MQAIEFAPEQPLVQEPKPPGIAASGLRPDDGLNLGRRQRREQPLQNSEVHALVFECERQVPLQIRLRRMPRGQNAPSRLDPHPMALPGR